MALCGAARVADLGPEIVAPREYAFAGVSDIASAATLLPLAADNLLAARELMAFTLGFHIILSCIGVALPAMMLIAEYRGRKHGDEDALALAQQWSKAAAVLFAVGAVTGHGALVRDGPALAEVHGALGRRLRHRLRDRGDLLLHRGDLHRDLHLRLEAARGLEALLDRRADRDRRHRRRLQRRRGQLVDEPAAGLRARRPHGEPVTDVDPLGALFNPATGLRVPAHAARRLHGRRLRARLDLRDRDGSRASADRRHRLGLLIPLHRRRDRSRRSSSTSATSPRAGSPTTSPPSSPAMECVYETGPDQTEWLGGICTDDGVKFGIGIPGLDSFLVGFSTDTVVTGLDQIPDDEEPPAKTLLHLAFDAMVGIGTALLLARRSGSAGRWWRRRGASRVEVVPARGRCSRRRRRGRARGGLDRHRGRAPAVDRLRATCGPRTR